MNKKEPAASAPLRMEQKDKNASSSGGVSLRSAFKAKLQEIGDLFRLPGEVVSYKELKDSPYSITYKVVYDTKKIYVFQNFTAKFGANVEDIMYNAELVTEHLRGKHLSSLHFHHTNFRENFIQDASGDNWRVSNYFDSKEYEQADDLDFAEQIGRAVASFQLSFLDFDPTALRNILPDYHNTRKLIEEAKEEGEITEYLKESMEDACAFQPKELPIRVTHNNTKINHFLFDQNNEPLALISLDLVMPATGLYDLAHAANEACIDKDGSLNLSKLKAYLEGYLRVARSFLSQEEIKDIPQALFTSAIESIAVACRQYHDSGMTRKLEKAKRFVILSKDIKNNQEAIKGLIEDALKAPAKKTGMTLNGFRRDIIASKDWYDYEIGEYMGIALPHKIKPKGGKFYAFGKRAFDIFASLMAIIILALPMLIIGLIVVCTSKGSAFYFSKRVGKNGKIFNFYKFRSMYKDADKRLDELLAKNEVEGGVIFKIKDDPRITPFGKFIRKTSLDELPQFFNVLKGDMSLIGPRVGLPREVKEYPEEALDRLLVPQGLSGEWQVNGRSTTTFNQMVEMDLDYIQNKRGFWYDIKLMFKTIAVVFKGKGAE